METGLGVQANSKSERAADEVRELEIELQRIKDRHGPDGLEAIRLRASDGDAEAREYYARFLFLQRRLTELNSQAAAHIEASTADVDFR